MTLGEVVFFNAALADLMQMTVWNFYEQADSVVNLCLAFNFSCCLLLSCVSAGSKKSCCPLVVNMQKLQLLQEKGGGMWCPLTGFPEVTRGKYYE